MGDEPYTTQRATFSQKSARSTNQLQAEYATERARVLFGSYRRGDANDPDAYVAAVAAVLSIYDVNLIREVTDPRTGIATTEKFMSFMPNAGELKVYCDGVAARRDHIRWLGALPAPDFSRARLPPPPRLPGDLATVFVPASHPRYSLLLAWSETANERLFKFESRPGIWVSYDTWDQRQTVAQKLPLPVEAREALDHPMDVYQEAE
ncbi:hypothetical protein [uncultured Bradyrhizobium sp.]|uniref:hypothetical protein n=1 Tax=uncultured Bradyrhizobium sp. TaxID=199684 RepID=UPI0035CC4B6F